MFKYCLTDYTGILPIGRGTIKGPLKTPTKLSVNDIMGLIDNRIDVYETNKSGTGNKVRLTRLNVNLDNSSKIKSSAKPAVNLPSKNVILKAIDESNKPSIAIKNKVKHTSNNKEITSLKLSDNFTS